MVAASQIDVVSSGSPKLLSFPAGGFGVIVPPRPITARTLFTEHPEVIAAVDGPMFSYCPTERHRDYSRYQCGRVDYMLLDRERGVSQPAHPGYETRGATLSLVGGQLTAGAGPATGAKVAIQGYPVLVRNGSVAIGQQAPTHPDSQRNHRVAIGIRAGRLVFAYSYTSMYQFAQQLAAKRVVDAVYTDGGGSASLVVRMPDGQLQGSDPADPDGRRVPSWVVWTRPQDTNHVLDMVDKTEPTAMSPVTPIQRHPAAVPLLVVGAVLAAGAVLWFTFRQ